MGAQVHPIDVVIFALVGFTFLALLGAPVMALEAGASFASIVGAIHHLGAETRAGVANWFVPFADHHQMHRSIRPEENGNYGNITTLFDQLFVSYVEPRPGDESPSGAFSSAEHGYPERDIGAQLLTAFGGRYWQRVVRPKGEGPVPSAIPPARPDQRWRRAWATFWLVAITILVAWLGSRALININ